MTRSSVWFFVVGLVNTLIYYVGYLMLHALAMGYLSAHVAATLIAMVWSYFLSYALTFQIRPSWNAFLLFPLSNVANFLITTVGIRLAVEQFACTSASRR